MVIPTKVANNQRGPFENHYPSEGAVHLPRQTPEALDAAEHIADETFVLLKDGERQLPIKSSARRIAPTGALANQPHEQMGAWVLDGRKEDSVTPGTVLDELVRSGRS